MLLPSRTYPYSTIVETDAYYFLYAIPRCNETCSDGYWGENCLNVCECQNDAVCDVYKGTCKCTPGKARIVFFLVI